jgi:hypothetical protein
VKLRRRSLNKGEIGIRKKDIGSKSFFRPSLDPSPCPLSIKGRSFTPLATAFSGVTVNACNPVNAVSITTLVYPGSPALALEAFDNVVNYVQCVRED